MRTKITDGVYLNVITSNQFKTTRINVQFLAPLRAQQSGRRGLLTSVLETNSAEYPTQDQLAARLEEMYGASFGFGVAREGAVHRMGAAISVLNDQYTDTPLLPAAFAFLRSVLMRPLMQGSVLDPATVQRERDNLLLYLASLKEDRGTQAALALQHGYFDDPVQAAPSFGESADIEGIDAQTLTDVYHDALTHDAIEIIVLGPVTTETVLPLAQQLGFAPRQVALSPGYDQPVHTDVRQFHEHAPVQQAKLNLGYHVESDDCGPRYFAAMVANQLFGGSPLSLLFRNVREQASLAYFASSSLNQRRHFMMVQTGIEAANRAQTEALIAEQLDKVVRGDFPDDLLQTVKDEILNGRESALDSQRFLMNQALTSALQPAAALDLPTFTARVQAVTKADVAAAAATFKLQAVYLLDGEEQ
ncbi:EF-P 5-aminopentanol modification-associated protein YfmF [Lacticaseibacillus thailandensis]|uniref:Zn-dependent peptidase n=1 Tax=Lacticaseibacillus thailandensis DSM 22698 = JCM 13996 TaxID=1423810 RepID=A0A0R2C8P9_9LACO|nr:insulinase family protein [Lacticaseibacillus thailandensis]KRM87754.1 Zn-dependent peptidase [Lacticaseibacillus thailandensis DSM 22698 = JCM 13996]